MLQYYKSYLVIVVKGGNIIKIFVNFLTTLRFVFALFLPLVKNSFSSFYFIISVALIFLTDSIDGILARKFNVKTLYGSIMDTVADKSLNVMLTILLVGKFKIVFLPLILEVVIALINTVAWFSGKKTKSRTLGKLKMWFISITILIGYVCYYEMLDEIFILIGSIVCAVMQIFVIIDYIIYLKGQKSSKNENKLFKLNNLKDILHLLFDTDNCSNN